MWLLHAEAYSDYFQISDGEVGIGSFAEFRAPQVSFRAFYDKELVQKISALALANHFPAGSEGTQKHAEDDPGQYDRPPFGLG